MRVNTNTKFENSVGLDTTAKKEEYSERDWEIICNLLEMNPHTTTAIHLDTYVEYIGDPMFECEFAKEFTVNEFVDIFGLNNYKKVRDAYKINEYYDDKMPIILVKNYDSMMKSVDIVHSIGIKGATGELLSNECIMNNIIKVKYVDRKEKK